MSGISRLASRSACLVCTFLLSALAACGGSEPPPKSQVLEEKLRLDQQDEMHGVRSSAEIGGMNEERVEATFKKVLGSLQKCLDRGAERVEFLGGSVSFFLKVDSTGKAERAYLEHSTLGDRDTEKCMIAALRARTWPKPVGGQHGLARKSFDFDPPNDVRPPTEWDPENTEQALKKLRDKISDCRDGTSGRFEATAYVSTEGSVITASVTPPDESGEGKLDCLVETIREANFPSPGSWPAKVSFPL